MMEHFYQAIFFTNILKKLDEKGMTKHQLAAKSGVSISFLSDLTTGKANPSLRIMAAIAVALETPLADLLENTDLDHTALDALAGGHSLTGIPQGYQRVHGILPDHKAYIVNSWIDDARHHILAAKAK